MTDALGVALITGLATAVPTTIAIILGARSQGKKTDVVVEKLDEQNQTAATDRAIVAAKADLASDKLEVVHGLVNSKLAEAVKEKEAALAEVERLRAIIEKRAQ